MELSPVLKDENLKCDFCGGNFKLRKIIADFKDYKDLNTCKVCRDKLLRMLRIELM